MYVMKIGKVNSAMNPYANLIVMEIVQQMKWRVVEMGYVKRGISLVMFMVNVTVIQVGQVPNVVNIVHINVIGSVQIMNMHVQVMETVLDIMIVIVNLGGWVISVRMNVFIHVLENVMVIILFVLIMEHAQVKIHANVIQVGWV